MKRKLHRTCLNPRFPAFVIRTTEKLQKNFYCVESLMNLMDVL